MFVSFDNQLVIIFRMASSMSLDYYGVKFLMIVFSLVKIIHETLPF